MATTVGRVELDVDADGSGLVRQLRVIGSKAGAAAGTSMSKSMTETFSREITQFDKEGGVTRIRESFRTLAKDVERSNVRIGSSLEKTGGRLGVLRGHVMRSIAAWTALVLIIGQGTAVLGSGLSAALTSLISSIGVGLVGALGFAGVAVVGFIAQIALMANSFRFLREEVPAVDSALTALGDTAEASGRRFAAAWGPSLARLLEGVNQVLGNTAIIDAFAASLSRITDAFTAVLSSPGFTLFQAAMETSIPAALANLGTAFASLTGGFAAIFAGAAPALEFFAGIFAEWAANWQATMEQMASDGTLNNFFTLAGESIRAILDLVGSLGNALLTLFQAGAPAGNALLGYLTQIFDQWNAWMQTVEGQNTLQEWFAQGQVVLQAVFDLLADLGPVLANLVTPESVESLVNFLDSLGQALPILGEIIGLVGDLQVLNLFAEVLNLISAILTPLMPVLSSFAQTLGVILLDAVAQLAPKFGELAEKLAPVLTAIGELIIALLPPLIDIVIAVMDQINAWIGVFSALDEAFGKNDEATSVWRDIVFGAFQFIGGIITANIEIWTGILNALSALLRGDASQAYVILQNAVRDAFASIGLNFDEIVQWLGDLLYQTGRVFGDMSREVGNFARDVGRFFGGIISAIQDLIGWFGSLFGAANNASGAVSGATGGGGGGRSRQAMASGGLLFNRTHITAGEAGPEAIVPLRRNLQQVNPEVRWLSAIAQGKSAQMASGGIVGAGRQVIFQAGAIVVQGTDNADAVAVGVLNRAFERFS